MVKNVDEADDVLELPVLPEDGLAGHVIALIFEVSESGVEIAARWNEEQEFYRDWEGVTVPLRLWTIALPWVAAKLERGVKGV